MAESVSQGGCKKKENPKKTQKNPKKFPPKNPPPKNWVVYLVWRVYLVPGGGGVSAPRGVYLVWGVPGPGGCTWSQGGCLLWGVYLVLGVICSGGVFLGGVPGPRGCLLCRGVYLVWGCVSALGVCLLPGGCFLLGGLLLGGVPGQVLPPVDRQMPENLLPCPKLHLRAVKMNMCRSVRGEHADDAQIVFIFISSQFNKTVQHF